ncbi:uncharacterized protein BP5553_09085 [Venustampulla echinocandica]|uniref:6-methylsalicylic acid synthase n=1 Tax=Venustampulla echinocandica TaxID=2656787 RepID=A0A370TDT5_9HELO|nr:uncharacterized protein BP5553_09085 [Venustampulla echinocandica]RDL32629.1 hypothetical protein BP5553_09085 [Venustampulla echinocandica]
MHPSTPTSSVSATHTPISASDDDETYTTSDSSISTTEEELQNNDVAIIGFACRAPGGNNSPAQLWDFLLQKGDACGEIPEMRWEPYMTRQPGNKDILAQTTSKGYFLDRLEDFDAAFFGISPREAELIDPQQRIAVEVAWEALENAGVPASSIAGSDAAVYMGVGSDDYSRLLLEDLPKVEAWMGVGTAVCGVPNRISYLLDLMGPSVAVDAACASSLVAIHYARQALIDGETGFAMAGGVNALVGPGLTRVLDEAGAISKDGRCRSFDDSAAGYGRGEGAGIVIMKRLADAINDGDRILAVLKGSAVGADGRTNGIMAPNRDAQERVARKALKEGGVSADTVGYIEAHATSTPIGDPTECGAMASVYGFAAREQGSQPCYVGSIKSNIGHLEAGAGVMGFIKAIMTVQNGIIPPQANLTTPNKKIDWETNMLRTVTTPTAWKSPRHVRRAAIASYGYGGTVSHAVIEEAPFVDQATRLTQHAKVPTGSPTILVLSAPQESRIKDAATDLASWLEDSPESVDLESVAYTLAVKRHHHRFRSVVVAESKIEAIQLLDDLARGKFSNTVFSGRTSGKDSDRGAVWVFSGHGAQWKEMGVALLENEPVFKDVIEELEPIIQEQLGFSAIDALNNGDFDAVDKVQALTYAMQVGLAAVLKASGATPKAIVGHSLGEIAASVVAGALTLGEGALICCIRARLYEAVAGEGAMYLVNMPMNEATKLLESYSDVVVAIDSSASSCVISGKLQAVENVAAQWTTDGYKLHRVKSDVAFHSPTLAPLEAPLRQKLSDLILPTEATIPLYSTSLDNSRDAAARDIDYWVGNMIKPVRLTTTIVDAAADGYRTFLEISAHPIVAHSINETLMSSDIDAAVLPTMLRGKNVRKCLLTALGRLHCIGEPISFKGALAGEWVPNVPATRWNHQPYWRKVTNPAAGKGATHDPKAHVLLGGRTQINGTNSTIWQTQLNEQLRPFPGRHPLHGSEIVPAAVLLHTFLNAAPGHALKNVSLRVPVVVEPPREVQVLLENNQMMISSRLMGSASSGAEISWLTNTKTQISPAGDLASFGRIYLCELKQRCTRPLSPTFSIDYLADVGVSQMGFPWKVIEHSESDTEMLALVHTDPEPESNPLSSKSWASMLDAATSVSSTIFYKDPLLRMPTAIGSVTISSEQPPKQCYIYVKKSTEELAADILIVDLSGNVVVEIQTLKFAGIEGSAGESYGELIYRMAWPPARLAEEPLSFKKVVLVADKSPLVLKYQAQLSALGIEHDRITDVMEGTDITDGSLFVMIANAATSAAEVYPISEENSERLLRTVKQLAKIPGQKLFCITKDVLMARDHQALSQSSLIGLARIMQSEEGEIFQGLVDVENDQIPLTALKYVQGVDVIRIQDGVARNARLRPFASEKLDNPSSFQVRSNGTYLITGGLGALGLEVATYLASQGARRLVLVSRRQVIPRRAWVEGNLETDRIRALEDMGVSVHLVSVDMCATDAATKLQGALDDLHLPPVLGVVHAAGTLANQPVMETTPEAFNSVISPKINGAIALNKMYPPKSIDFMVLFSSCGQLLGFPGQAAYASGNSFLDAMATHRQALGDMTISMLWTSWRSLGMAASTRYIDAELHARGITDITRDEAFVAWERIFKAGIDQAVILHTLLVEADEAAPHPIVSDIITRRAVTAKNTDEKCAEVVDPSTLTGAQLEASLNKIITGCVASTLSLSESSVDPHMALSELGMDSVMTVGLRMKLQQALKVKVGPTLVWNCPTVGHLVHHFIKERST